MYHFPSMTKLSTTLCLLSLESSIKCNEVCGCIKSKSKKSKGYENFCKTVVYSNQNVDIKRIEIFGELGDHAEPTERGSQDRQHKGERGEWL